MQMMTTGGALLADDTRKEGTRTWKKVVWRRVRSSTTQNRLIGISNTAFRVDFHINITLSIIARS